MTEFDTTATIINYTAYKAGRAEVRQAPVIDCSDGEIIDGEGHPLSFDSPVRFVEDSSVNMNAPEHDVCAALLAIRETLIDATSPVFENQSRAPRAFDMEVMAAHRRGETLIVMRLRHAPPPL